VEYESEEAAKEAADECKGEKEIIGSVFVQFVKENVNGMMKFYVLCYFLKIYVNLKGNINLVLTIEYGNNMIVSFCWWCYPTSSEGWGCRGTPQRPNSRATPQGLDQRSNMEEVVRKIARRRGSDAGQSRRR